ncbi:aminotransferase class I/II-fold pyridoxal phosphate-dependent enzyme [Aneurinibacillus uraniidurans]|uniref:aminotransferase class I/II-fold pyridoxal phosphate-dependent enzyme n=1 Tax=Aneurinibacillus uraniidurans TaxID=2966586 RepID=UPI00234B7B80|nr:aminotransferase class I/II-fold pyridoxal phosphate-dependent enzyme [Aneurinibacillus sp. B1]WCN37810.1 aminotransferase class I/II-fold pyridoxal phosphate-dependent enzyme [Aneurinibacillus sp. B1]
MNQKQAPLYEALCTYVATKNEPLHVPGHKDGQVFDQEARRHFASILPIDATEVKGLDDLHHPEEAIAVAQQLAAEAFGAEQTFFLVGGTTAGNLAAALAVCRPGEQILVQRNAHKSVFNGLLLAGANPVFIAPEIEHETEVASCLHPSFIKKALQEYPDIRAVWLTNPSYYGMGMNLKEAAEICHTAGVPLLVDEAHGAHYGQAEVLPESALMCGADLVVQSTHKMLPAMTMASMLHVRGERIDRNRLATVLAMVQSSSPSYPLLASLDVARRYLVQEGREKLTESIERLEQAQIELSRHLQSVTIWSGAEGIYSRDPLKWVIRSTQSQVTGYQLLEWLEEEGCTAEMADPRNVVLVFAIDTDRQVIERAAQALSRIDRRLMQVEQTVAPVRTGNSASLWLNAGETSVPARPLQEAFHSSYLVVSLDKAIGCCCAEMVIPYPPGIPLLIPGEIITGRHVQMIVQIRESGGYFQGALDPAMKTIKILC